MTDTTGKPVIQNFLGALGLVPLKTSPALLGQLHANVKSEVVSESEARTRRWYEQIKASMPASDHAKLPDMLPMIAERAHNAVWPGTDYKRLPDPVREETPDGKGKWHFYDSPAYRAHMARMHMARMHMARMQTGSINHAKQIRGYHYEANLDGTVTMHTVYADGTRESAKKSLTECSISYDPGTQTQVFVQPNIVNEIKVNAQLDAPQESEADRIMRITREMACG